MLLPRHSRALCGTLLVVAASAGLLLSTQPSSTAVVLASPETSIPAAHSDTLNNELKTLRETLQVQALAIQSLTIQIAALQAQQKIADAAAPPVDPHNPATGNRTSTTQPLDGLSDSERTKQYHQKIISGAEEKLNSEPIDNGWRGEMEAELAASMAAIDVRGSQLTHTQCASSLCKISVMHQDEASMTHFVEKMSAIKPWNTGAYIDIRQNDKTFTTVIYLSRTGHDLPSPHREQESREMLASPIR